MESNSYSASESSASSKIAESNRESAYIVDPLQHDHTNLAKVLGHTDSAMSKASADARLDSLKGHKSQNSQPPKEVVAEGPCANATIDPYDLLRSFVPFDTGAGAEACAISASNVFRSMDPTDTPELSTSGSSEPNSDISEGVGLSINIEVFDNMWQPFGPAEVNGLFDMNDLNNAEYDSIESRRTVFDGKQPALNSSSLDDVSDTSSFDKPFTLNTSIYSMASPPTPGFDLEEFNIFGNSLLENAWSLSKSDPIHLASVPVDQKPTAPSGTIRTSSRASRIFKCWVETCSHFNEGFLTLKQRRTHYEKVHSQLILTCRVEGCKASPFLREQDRTKHENRMHSEQKVEESHTEGPADVNEIAETNHISVGNLFQIRPGSERSPTEDTEVASASSVRSNEPTLQPSQSSVTSSQSKFGHISPPTSKRLSADDVVEVPNPNTLPSGISQEATLPSGSPIISGVQRSSSVCSDCSVGFDTDSTWSGEESDWEDEGLDPNELLAQIIQDSEVAVRPLLTPMKQELVSGIMKEFWVIFSQEWSANIQNCSGTPNSTSSLVSQNKGETGNEPNKDNRGQKRQRDNDGGDEDFDGDGKRDPKRPRIESPSNVSQEKRKFACPYRKHDPRTYCHRIRCWRPCALTPLETIARVKGHLYRYHRIFQCLRCKVLQTNEDELKKHVLEVKGCEVKDGQPVEGITSDIEKQLKSRKKTHRDQPEGERWQEMYRILFPMEEVPSPYFEAIQDNIMRSPESEELTSYEEYSRRELPRLFRDALEAAIADEAQPIEERLRSQLVGMIQDCQDRVFSAYRSRRSFDSPSSNHVVARSPLGHSRLSSPIQQAMPNSAEVANTGIVEALYEGAPLQASHPETDVTDATSKHSTENPPSDSGYISEPSLLSSDSFASQTIPAGNSQQQQSPKTPPPAAEISTEMPSHLHLSLEETRMQTYELPNIPVPELTMDQSIDTGFENFDFEKWMPSIGEGAFQEYWNQWDNNFQ